MLSAAANSPSVLPRYDNPSFSELPVYEVLSDDQFDYMKESLVDDFYMLSDIEQILLRRFRNANPNLINAYNVKNLGYKIYCNYAIKDSYAGASDYFRSMLTKTDIVDTREEKWASSYIITYGAVLYKLLADRTIVEFNPKQYISINRLNEVGITKEMLSDYCEKVFSFTRNKTYFTIKSLRNDGFEHELDELGFSEWFYSSLLANAPEKFDYRRMGGSRLFVRAGRESNLGLFLEYLLEEKKKIEIEDLEVLLYNEYGLSIDRYKLVDVIKDTGLYYDSIMETVYCDYDTYFEEV